MNILWVINGIREHQYTMLGLDRNSGRASGTWLEAAYRAAKGNKDIHLHLAATHDVPELMHDTNEGNTFYILPNRGGGVYDHRCHRHAEENSQGYHRYGGGLHS